MGIEQNMQQYNNIETKADDYFHILWSKIDLRHKACFFAAFAVGILTHLMMLTNKLPNWDDISCTPGVGGGTILGRWLQQYVHGFFSVWSAPAMNGVMAILFLSLAACFVIDIIGLRTVTASVLTGIFFVTFPSAVSILLFMFLAPEFGLAMLLSMMGTYFADRPLRRKNGTRAGAFASFAFGSILLMLSLALYQSYFVLAAALLVLCCILECIDRCPGGEILRHGIYRLAYLAAGMLLYLLSILIRGDSISNYRGMNDMGSVTAREWMNAFLRDFHRVLQYFVTSPPSFITGFSAVLSRCVAILTAILLIAFFFTKKIYRDRMRGIFYILLMPVQVMALGLTYIMAPTTEHGTTMMTFSYVVLYLILAALSERIGTGCLADPVEGAGRSVRRKVSSAAAVLAVILLVCSAYSFYRIDNMAYYRTYIASERMKAFYNRIAARLEEQDGYDYGQKVMILRSYWPDKIPVQEQGSGAMDYQLYDDLEGLATEDKLFISNLRQCYMNLYLGVGDGAMVTQETMDKYLDDPRIAAMPSWPADGCIQKMDDIWFVKMTDKPGY